MKHVGGDAPEARLVLHADRRLAEHVDGLVRQRMVFFAGLPGTGKSLLVHQVAHLASARGRTVHLLQWDVARPVFEASVAGQRYPLADGVTHPIIRKAAGRWVRQAVVDWSMAHPGVGGLLIGETPFVGHRFVDLAQRRDDGAEPLLTDRSCRFVITVPSIEVRRFLEAERERRAANPLHPREREDAPPSVLRDLWRDLVAVAGRLGMSAPAVGAGTAPYDPAVYRKVYETVLRHRNVESINLDVILPTERLSVYDFAVPPAGLMPTEAEISACLDAVESEHADPATLEREMADWWKV